MRIKLKFLSEFFEELIGDSSLRHFCLEKKIDYSAAKKWRRGEYLIPKDIFDKLLSLIENKAYFLKNVEYLEDGWGRVMGGKNAAKNAGREKLLLRMKRMRNKKRIKKVKIIINKSFLEFYGALMGDGCLSKVNRSDGYKDYYILFTGHKVLDRDYHENYLKSLVKREFNLNLKTKERKNENTIDTKMRSKALFIQLEKMGFPVGKKLGKLYIPKKFCKLSWSYKKFMIRGLFDTDGCISARKDEGYKYPIISISNNDPKFINDLYSLLKERKYNVWKSDYKKEKYDIRLRGIKNTLRWMDDIGSSNERHLSKYNHWLRNGVVPVKTMGR